MMHPGSATFVMQVVTAFFIVINSPQGRGQTFTSVTEGSPVSDGGASRSVNWVDVNNDGWLDLFVTNGLAAGEDNVLYINNGPDSGYSFRKLTGDPIVTDHARSDGSSWADVDNDGDLDAFVVNWYGDDNLVYLNNGDGTFVQVFDDPAVGDGGYSETCTWGDYDNDGDVDLYVTNSGYNAIGPQTNFLYENDGNGHFTRISDGDPVTDAYYSRGAVWIDYDRDGDSDLFVANENNQVNNFYRNLLVENGVATFQRVTGIAPVTGAASSWSASWGDYDNDGDEDLFVANGPPYAQNDDLFVNNGDGSFTEAPSGPIVTDAAFSACGAWGDYDNDGDLDLYVTTAYSGAQTTNRLYRNLLRESGSGSFELVVQGPPVEDRGYSYGCAWGDYNGDGFLDLCVARTWNENQDNRLYRNDGTNGNHWLTIRCRGTSSNRSGIGATIRLKARIAGQEVWQTRTISGQSGYCGQNLVAHFGLGDAVIADSVVVTWPSGTIDVWPDVAADNAVTLTEGETVSVEGSGYEQPERTWLHQNYPNPFNPSTVIRYDIARAGNARVDLFDTIGRHVAVLAEGHHAAGTHELSFTSSGLSSGMYFYALSAAGFRRVRQMVLIK
jgi:hypothetical protein